MKRIVIDQPSAGELADEFRKSGSGTKLLSRYAVIAIDDAFVD
jgi:hypothetical protein